MSSDARTRALDGLVKHLSGPWVLRFGLLTTTPGLAKRRLSSGGSMKRGRGSIFLSWGTCEVPFSTVAGVCYAFSQVIAIGGFRGSRNNVGPARHSRTGGREEKLAQPTAVNQLVSPPVGGRRTSFMSEVAIVPLPVLQAVSLLGDQFLCNSASTSHLGVLVASRPPGHTLGQLRGAIPALGALVGSQPTRMHSTGSDCGEGTSRRASHIRRTIRACGRRAALRRGWPRGSPVGGRAPRSQSRRRDRLHRRSTASDSALGWHRRGVDRHHGRRLKL